MNELPDISNIYKARTDNREEQSRVLKVPNTSDVIDRVFRCGV